MEIIAFLSLIMLATSLAFWAMNKRQRLLAEKHLRDQGYTIITLNRQIFPRGPFKGAPPAGNYGIYRIHVIKNDHNERGWIRVITPFIFMKPRFDISLENATREV